MNTWKVILATLVIFGTGVITGGLLVSYSDRALHRPGRRTAAADNPRLEGGASNLGGLRENRLAPPMPGPLRKDFLNRLDRELRLSPEQRQRIEQIIGEGQERTRKIWQQVEPDMQRALMDARARMRNELTPEQRKRFQELLRQRGRDNPRTPPVRNSPTNAPSTTLTNSAVP